MKKQILLALFVFTAGSLVAADDQARVIRPTFSKEPIKSQAQADRSLSGRSGSEDAEKDLRKDPYTPEFIYLIPPRPAQLIEHTATGILPITKGF